MLLQEGDHCLFCTGYPIFVALATANLDSVYVIPRSRQINQTTVGDKRLSLCLRAFRCPTYILTTSVPHGCSTPPHRQNAALQRCIFWWIILGLVYTHTHWHKGLKKKEQMTPNIFIGITVWNVAESVTQSQSLWGCWHSWMSLNVF